MAKRGGSAGATGYDYQFWFIAYQISKLILDENLIIHPEAEIIRQPEYDSNGQIIGTIPKINFVDDVIVYEKNIPTVYNIKYLAPQDSSWTIGKLISEGVIKDLLQQLKSFPDQNVTFVSQSSCPLFHEIFIRVRTLNSKKEVDLTLNKKQKQDWAKLKTYTKLNDTQLIKISKYVKYERGLEIEKYKELILSFSKGKFDKYEQVPHLLYALAIDSCRESKPLSLMDFINYLEKNNIRAISIIKIDGLIKEAKKASASLENWNNIFGNIESSHIKRAEVDKIVEWIGVETPQDKKPILVITGKAGCGKSVIMRDVLEELDKSKTNCIGLKVDLYDAYDFGELNAKLNLNEDFEKIINSLAATGSFVIVLDQLDSLSMSLSSSRKSLNFYFDLINRLCLIPKIKIILSCRNYDLNFDPSLKTLDKETKIVVGELSDQEIDNVLNYLGLLCKKLPEKLLKLLRNPQHLNIFCTIYDKNVKLEEIKSIQDLYNELWQKKISNNINNFPKLVDLIKEIVTEMSEEQKLNVAKIIYQDKYVNEMSFLLSEGIFSYDKKSLQFFHQTFFEYCFARLFVTDKNDLVKYILKSHQGLFIRSTIKHVLTYMKSVTPKEYLKTVYELLVAIKVRLHIKFLILSMIASDDISLEEEWEILKKIIINKRNLRPLFLESITNIFWFNKLYVNGYLTKYLAAKDEDLKKSCETIFYKLIEIEPIPVLKYLLNSKEFNNKNSLVNNILFYLKDWDNKESIELFESIKNTYDNNYDFHLDTLLGKAFQYHKEWVAKFLEQYITKRIDYYCSVDNRGDIYGHEIEEILKKFYKNDPELVVETILPLIKKLVYCSKFDSKTEYIVDKAFYGYEQFDSIYAHWRLLNHLIDFSEKLVINDPIKFKKMILPLKNESSLSLINILISGFLIIPQNFVDEIFDFLIAPNFLRDYSLDLGIKYKIKKLINSSYNLFSDNQKNQLNKIIMQSENEKLKKNEERRWKGSHIYNLLIAIPDDEKKLFPNLQKKYLELQRKFGIWQIEESHKAKAGSVGPPLPEKAYEKMTFENWLNSMKEYNESTGWDQHFNNKRGFHFGGLVEHSRVFGTSVKRNPERFFPFLENILEENITADYISEGLIGLTEANYDPQKVASLIKKTNANEKAKKIRKSIIRAIEYVDRNSPLDNELFEIIKDFSLNDSDPSEEIWTVNADRNVPYYGGDPLTAGINSVRGSAVFALVTLKARYNFKNEIFNILEKIAEDKSLSVKCSAVANLNVLISVDEERTFKIFYLFAKDMNPHILRNSLNCLSYYAKRKFQLIKDILIASSKIEGDYGYTKVKHFVGQIVMYLYTEGVGGSKNLFESLFSSPEIQAGALNYSFYLIIDKNSYKRSKSRKVFLDLLNSRNQSIQNEYSHSFHKFTPEMFSELYTLLLAYCKNRNAPKRESYNLYKYLLDCMNLYPKECINLINHLIKNFEAKKGEFYSTEDTIKLLIGSYNTLKEYKLKNIYLEKAMDIFDELVQIPNFRYTTNKVLYEADYE